jgi:DNA end-binding protein Ku
VGKKPFVLLRKAIADGRRVGVAHLTMAQKEYLCAIRLYGDTMMLNTLRYDSEVRAAPAIPSIDDVNINEKEIAMARSLVDALSEEFDPSKYHARYRDGLLELIEKKQEGQTVTPKPPTATKGAAMDLMAAMRASVDAARGRARESAAGKKASAKPAAAQKAAPTQAPAAAAGTRIAGKKAAAVAPPAEPVAITARRSRKAG